MGNETENFNQFEEEKMIVVYQIGSLNMVSLITIKIE